MSPFNQGWSVEVSSPDSAERKRPQLDARSQCWAVLIALLTLASLAGVFFLPSHFQNTGCPQSSFKHARLIHGAGYLVFGICVGTISMVLLPVCVLTRHHRLAFSGETQLAQSGKYNTAFILISAFGVLLSGAAFINDAKFYYCLTPTNIVVRSGFFDTPRQLTWGDVNTVQAWCSTVTPPKAAPYKAATLKLSFINGKDLLIGMTSGGEVSMQDDENIKKALADKDYQYYVNSTVNPDSCPSGLYPVLWNWRNG